MSQLQLLYNGALSELSEDACVLLIELVTGEVSDCFDVVKEKKSSDTYVKKNFIQNIHQTRVDDFLNTLAWLDNEQNKTKEAMIVNEKESHSPDHFVTPQQKIKEIHKVKYPVEEKKENNTVYHQDMKSDSSQMHDVKEKKYKMIRCQDVNKRFLYETSNTAWYKTVILCISVIISVIIPAVINIYYIQPVISKNNVKFVELSQYYSKISNNIRLSDHMVKQLDSIKQNAKRIVSEMVTQEQFEHHFQKFVTLLERYDVTVKRIHNELDVKNSVLGRDGFNVKVNIITLNIEARYETYRMIRETFIKEIKTVSIIDESFIAHPNYPFLSITVKMAVAYAGDNI